MVTDIAPLSQSLVLAAGKLRAETGGRWLSGSPAATLVPCCIMKQLLRSSVEEAELQVEVVMCTLRLLGKPRLLLAAQSSPPAQQ